MRQELPDPPGARAAAPARRLRFCLLVLLAGAVAAVPLGAQEGREGALMAEQQFAIPAQPLPAALLAFSQASGVQVLFDSSRARTLRSHPVRGTMSAGQALRQMLRGSGFGIRYASASSVTLVVVDAAASGEESGKGQLTLAPLVVKAQPLRIGGRGAYIDYAGSVLGTLRQAVQRGSLGEAASFVIEVRIWLDATGHLVRSEVQRSTGRAEVDAAILRRLEGAAIAPPPEGLPQPMQFRLWAGPQ